MGSAAAWVGALGTILALLAAIYTFRRDYGLAKWQSERVQAVHLSAWLQVTDTLERADLALEEERQELSRWHDALRSVGYKMGQNETLTHDTYGRVELKDVEALYGPRPKKFFIIVSVRNGSPAPVWDLSIEVRETPDDQGQPFQIFRWPEANPDKTYPPLTSRSWRLSTSGTKAFDTEEEARQYRMRCEVIVTFNDDDKLPWERKDGVLTSRLQPPGRR